LLKSYKKLWVFGDSYTTPNVCVSPKESFWGLTAAGLNIDTVVNCSRPVNSFTSVQHLLVSASQKIDWENDLVFVGIPPLERITIFDNHKDTPYYGHQIDTTTWETSKFELLSHRGLVSLQNYGTDRELIIHSDRSWLETDVLRQVFLLTQWLDSIGANYLILNLSKDFDENNIWGPSEFVLSYCKQHPRCLIFKNTYCSINIGVNKPADSDMPYGHHGAAGNAYFFNQSLWPKLKECNLC
jgi:hypothetical protein